MNGSRRMGGNGVDLGGEAGVAVEIGEATALLLDI